MKPFEIEASLRKLLVHYPDPALLLQVALEGGKEAQETITRLWLSEGIPSVFSICPAIYDSIRCWIADRLEVKAKEIGLVGSAQLGKSFDPHKLGAPFIDNKSDLDFFIISDNLFAKLKKDFARWAYDFTCGRLTATNRERRFWKSNLKRSTNNIHQGFIDANTIPSFSKYPTAEKIQKTMELLIRRLKNTEDAPKPKKASIRCYTSWDSFVQQKSLNLRILGRTVEKIALQPTT